KYGHFKRDPIQQMGDTIEEINRKSGVDTLLYQGDMFLTEEQAAEILEDIQENEAHRNKRQEYRDKKYPNTTWSRRVNFYFWNASLF
ncbi:hypothetical protein Angca_002943, partial [Angiostrongylus cantonensis]